MFSEIATLPVLIVEVHGPPFLAPYWPLNAIASPSASRNDRRSRNRRAARPSVSRTASLNPSSHTLSHLNTVAMQDAEKYFPAYRFAGQHRTAAKAFRAVGMPMSVAAQWANTQKLLNGYQQVGRIAAHQCTDGRAISGVIAVKRPEGWVAWLLWMDTPCESREAALERTEELRPPHSTGEWDALRIAFGATYGEISLTQ